MMLRRTKAMNREKDDDDDDGEVEDNLEVNLHIGQ
jgi:hypothetical protein